EDGDVNVGALGAFQHVGNVSHAKVVCGLAVDGQNRVAGAQPGLVSRSSHERRYHNDLVVARGNLHAYAVVFPALLFAQQRVRLRIKEVGMRIEHVQHSGNGPVVNGLVGIYRLSVVLLDQAVDLGKLLQAVTDVSLRAVGAGGSSALAISGAQKP